MERTNRTQPHQRSHKRFRVDGAANLMVEKTLEKPVMIKDLSPRGVGTVADYPFKKNQKVTLTMVMPFLDNPITKTAKVVWSKRIDNESWQRGKRIDNELWEAGLDFGFDNMLTFPLS